MSKKFFIGIDIASDDFTASIYQTPSIQVLTRESIENSYSGFKTFIQWINDNHATDSNCIICMESTGVYCQHLAFFLVSCGYNVCIEPPLKVKRAFDVTGHKTDPVDSRQIAEYAFRFQDELKAWIPQEEVIQEIKQLLTARELLTKQSTATQNALKAALRQVVSVSLITNSFQENIKRFKELIKHIDQQIDMLIKNHPLLRNITALVMTIPGIGLLFTAALLVNTNGFKDHIDNREISAYLGICPYMHQSGKSVYRRPSSRHFGPSYTRKLIHLASRSVATHDKSFRSYYLRKIAEGKDKKLVLNNISNKLVKIACAVIKKQRPYSENYCSINPVFFKFA